jgi:hypothetical protein
MRINGEAKAVHIGDMTLETTGSPEDHLVVGIEEDTCFIVLVDETGSSYLSYTGFPVEVEWLERPNVQSRTEWLAWLAEAFGEAHDLEASGMGVERKFYPKGAKHNSPVVMPSPPVNPTQEQGVELKRSTVMVSTVNSPVDEDAGGPDGFDPELNSTDLTYEPAPQEFKTVVIPKVTRDVPNLKGKEIYHEGELLRVVSVEVGEDQGVEVLFLKVEV